MITITDTNTPWQAEITGPYPGWPWLRYRITYHRGIATLTDGDFARTTEIAARKAKRRLQHLEAQRLADSNRRVINP